MNVTTAARFSAQNQSAEAITPTLVVLRTVVLPLILTVVCVIGLCGNGAVLYIMLMKKRRSSITDIFVTNLTLADFIFLSFLPFWIVEMALNGRWIFGRVCCKVASGFTLLHMYASVFCLVAMAVDRLMAVVFYPKCEKLRSRCNARVACIVVWLVSAVFSAVPFYFRDLKIDNTTGHNGCHWTFGEDPSTHRAWLIVHAFNRSVIGFFIPLMLISVCYVSIAVFLKARKTRGRITGKLQDRATKLVLLIIIIFLVCWLPNLISNFVYTAQSLKLIHQPNPASMLQYCVHLFATCMAWGHSCINPILYTCMCQDLKAQIRDLFLPLSKKSTCESPARKTLPLCTNFCSAAKEKNAQENSAWFMPPSENGQLLEESAVAQLTLHTRLISSTSAALPHGVETTVWLEGPCASGNILTEPCVKHSQSVLLSSKEMN